MLCVGVVPLGINRLRRETFLVLLRALRCLFFFFSSRRRHTRWPRDWSSDVCSSDLVRATSLFRGRPADGWRLRSDGAGMDVLAGADEAGDFRFEGRLVLGPGARQGGLGFRMDERGGGYFVELSLGSAEVVLGKWLTPPD